MPIAEFRLFFDNDPAKREQLDRVDKITVEQEVDMAWEARIEMPVCVDEKGIWKGEDEGFMESFSRVRVEIRVGGDPFVALIDGPIVGYDNNKSSEPGQSSIILMVRDDSVYLNREEQLARFEDMADHEIAAQLFGEAEQIASTDIDDTPRPAGNLMPVVIQRGTSMQILRALARRQGMHAYVLPGEEPGQSIGCFKSFSTEAAGLPPLILLGTDRNIERFNVAQDAQSPSRVQAFRLSITDKVVMSSTSSFRDLDLLGPEHAFEDDTKVGTQISIPGLGSSVDLDRRVTAEADRASYAFEATGSVLAGCYRGVLQPYRVVSVRGVNDRLGGDHLINTVTHTLTRSEYSQSFALKRNARSEGPGGDAGSVAGSVF